MTRITAHCLSTLYMETTASPALQSPLRLACSMASLMHSFAAVGASVLGSAALLTTTGMRPLVRRHCLATWSALLSVSGKPIECRLDLGTTPTMVGWAGRYFAMHLAAVPLAARTTMMAACTLAAVSTALDARLSMVLIGESDMDVCSVDCASARLSTHSSASSHIPAMVCTASSGYAPAAVSPLSMTQSVPSSTALATSVASARVGLGAAIMLSSICVAVMTGFAARLHLRIIIFCTQKILLSAISIPRSPRATITPSARSRMASKFTSPSWFSTLATTRMLLPSSPSTERMRSMSLPLRTNDAATKSTPCATPKPTRSSTSLFVRVGRSTTTPGRLQFLRSPSLAELSITHRTVPDAVSVDSTSIITAPSAMRTRLPGERSRARLG
mmetsp:Transcript_12972/g.45038  ORF Transcript_12972/g.45038 Transcript_12972/m.45038 type:complete len:388 (-) Transcript_12972:477-1640(-)